MKRTLLVLLTLVMTMLLGMSTLSVGATDIYPDLLEVIFDADGAYNFTTGSDLETMEGQTPVLVYDETAETFFLRTSTDDPDNFLISKEPTDVLGNMFKNLKLEDPELDLSFAWEFMVRLPEMPEQMTFGSGYYASGGFSFAASQDQGHFLISSGTSDEDAQDHFLHFDMEANKWYHCILMYDDFEHKFYAYVNGERAKSDSGEDFVSVNPFRFSYLWHWGLQIGGGNIELKRVDLSQDIAICNVYSQLIPEEDALAIYDYVAETWGMEQKVEATATPSATPEVTATPDNTPTPDDETSSASSKAPEAPSSDSDGSSTVLIVALVAAVLVIGGGVTAGILVVKKKK